MKNITSILKRALRKSAKEFIYEGSWCDKHSKGLLDYDPIPAKPSIITEQLLCNPYQSRTPNDWTNPGPPDACAASGLAIKCDNIPAGFSGTLADLASGPGTMPFNSKIKLFPPAVPLSNAQQGGVGCQGGWPAVPGDYMLSHGGTAGTGTPTTWIPYLILESNGFTHQCSGPRTGHYECAWSDSGCQDATALNYSPTYNTDCTQNPTYPSNCIGGTTGANCCCEYSQLEGCTDPTALNYDPNAIIDNGSCIYSTFDCISGLCEENIAGTGVHATLNDCLVSQDCDRWECKTSADPGAMEEQIAPQPTISNCVKCDVNRYDIVNEMWDPLCQYFDKQECDEECTPVETPVDPCEDFVLGTFQGVNPCCELCGTDGSGGWNTSTYVGPMTHPNLPQCWYTCQCCTMPVNCSGNNPAGECFVCHHDVNSNQPPSSCAQLSSFPSNWWQSVGMPQGFNAYNTEADCLAAGVGCIDATSPVGKDIECMQCDSGGAPVANMFPGPLCPAGWTPAQQFNPSSCKQPAKTAKMIEPTKDVRDIEVPLNEGLQLKGELLNKSRMTKLANINKK
jgi:hypothetical protein